MGERGNTGGWVREGIQMVGERGNTDEYKIGYGWLQYVCTNQ